MGKYMHGMTLTQFVHLVAARTDNICADIRETEDRSVTQEELTLRHISLRHNPLATA